jgi:hypothetical protein
MRGKDLMHTQVSPAYLAEVMGASYCARGVEDHLWETRVFAYITDLMSLQNMLELGLDWIRNLLLFTALLVFALENVLQLMFTVLIGDTLVNLLE